jgi:hypothetical protein
MSKDYIKDVFMVLIGDEKLKRLLWYPPENILTNTPDPLSPTLPDISNDDDTNWKVIEDRILRTSKSDDLADEPKCRVYLYLGDVVPTSHSVYVKQNIVIDVLWNEVFDIDQRSNSIALCLKDILVNKYITGMGKMMYEDGNPINSPKNYSGYRHIFQVGSTRS